jgi:hypothetical protein
MHKLAGTVLAVAGLVFANLALGATDTVVHSFNDNVDGSFPHRLVAGDDGNLYGAVASPGPASGTVLFQMTPAGDVAPLASVPDFVNVLTKGITGNLFGVASGDSGQYLFKLTPAGTFTVLHTISDPRVGTITALVQGPDARLYGASRAQDSFHNGSIFRYAIGTGTLSVLHEFQPGEGSGSLVQGADGNFYGIASAGSPSQPSFFRISPTGTFVTLHSFGAGERVPGFLRLAADGNFYGTSARKLDGSDCGAVMKLTPAGAASLVSIFACDDVYDPYGLVQADDGNFYGLLAERNTCCNLLYDFGGRIVFRTTPAGKSIRVNHFRANYLWSAEVEPLVLGLDGNLYAAAYEAGSSYDGAILRFSDLGADVVNIYPLAATARYMTQTACKSARLFDANNVARPNVPITFVRTGANPASVTVTANAAGVANHCWTAANAGTDVVTASAGGASDRSTVDWIQRPTTLTAEAYIRIVSPTKIEISPRARLVEQLTGAPMAGRTIAFSVTDGDVGVCSDDPYYIWGDAFCVLEGSTTPLCSATTGADGVAQCKTTVTEHLLVVLDSYDADYSGDAIYSKAHDTGGLIKLP